MEAMEDEYKQPMSARSQLSQETNTSMSVTSDMSWLLSLNAGNSMAASKMNIDVMCNPESFDKIPHPMTKEKVHKKKKKNLTRAEALALSLGMRKGARDQRLNSPYAAGSYKPAFLHEDASAPTQKKGKSQKLSSKHSKVSPITQIYKNIRDGRTGNSTVSELAAHAESMMHTMGSKEKHRRMMALVHAHTDKKPWIIPKIDPKAEFGGEVAGTDMKYMEYYKYKLGIRDKQASEPDIFHAEHNLTFKETPLQLAVDTDAPPIHRDPLYRIMREEAELHNLRHQKMQPSTIKSVPPKPLPAYINGLSRYVLQAKALNVIKGMLKPNSEIWTTMRAVCFLFVCYHEAVVLANASESKEEVFVLQSVSTAGSKTGDTNPPTAAGEAPLSSDTTLGSKQLANFWISFGVLLDEFRMNSANFVNVFTWEFVVKFLSLNSVAVTHILGDIENGTSSTPKVMNSDIVIGMKTVDWRKGRFYHEVANSDYMCAGLRIVASNACFTPNATFKAYPSVASLCQWSRNIIAGVFATKAILSRVAAKFPKVAKKPALSNHLEAPLDDISVISDEQLMQHSVTSMSEASSVLATALGNIASTIPGSYEEHILATQRTDNLQQTQNMKDHDHAMLRDGSPQKRIGHFIQTSTLQSNALNYDLPPDVMTKTNEMILSDRENTVAHKKNSKVDDMSEMHIVAYLPLIEFPTTLTEIEESGSEFNVGVPLCALATARPCDRVDLLLGTRYVKKSEEGIDSVLRSYHRNEVFAKNFFSHMIMAKTRSPLHQVHTSPYDDTNEKRAANALQSSTEGANGASHGKVSFKNMQKLARKVSLIHETENSSALQLEESKVRNKGGKSLIDSLLDAEERTGDTSFKAVETREDLLYTFLHNALLNHDNKEQSKRRDSQAYAVVKKSTFVFIKDLHQVFCTAHEHANLRLPSIVMLTPEYLQRGVAWPTFSGVSRFVCCLGTGSLNKSAFQTTLRLAKPGDLVFLVHIIRREDELIGDKTAADLASHYQNLGFNLHISLESQLVPPGPDAVTQFSKAILTGSMIHNPTHIVLGANASEIQFSFNQTSTSKHNENPNLVESIIRHEKYLSKLHPEFQDFGKRRPALVLTHAM